MKSKRTIASTALALFVSIGLIHGHAQSPAPDSAPSPTAAGAQAGGLIGHVFNAATGDFLGGAEVDVNGTHQQVFTDQSGTFSLPHVGVGTVVLIVKYPGLDTASRTIEISPGQLAQAEVGLSNKEYREIVKLGAFVVPGQTEGAAAAISQEEAAANIVNVVSAEQYANTTGGNVGEFLRNMAGVEVDYSGQEPRVIRVRGMDPNLSAVTMDGQRLAEAASAAAARNFEVEQMSMEDVAFVEVTKAPRPDQEADMGLGAVNFVSKTAFQREGRHFNFEVDTTSDQYDLDLGRTPGPGDSRAEKIREGAAFTYSDVFSVLGGKQNLGVVVAFQTTDFYNDGALNFMSYRIANTAVDPLNPTNAYLSENEIEMGGNINRRHAVSINLDYKLTPETTLHLYSQANYNWIENRGSYWYVENTAPAAGYTDTQMTATPASGTLSEMQDGSQNKHGNMTSFDLGAKSIWGSWTFDWDAAISQSSSIYTDLPGNLGYVYALDRNIGYSQNSPYYAPYPTVTQLSGPSMFQISNYTTLTALSQDRSGMDRFSTGKMNLRRKFDTTLPFFLQIGVDGRDEKRMLAGPYRIFSYVGPNGNNLGVFGASPTQQQGIAGSNYAFPYVRPQDLSVQAVSADYFANPQNWVETQYYNIEETELNQKYLDEKVYATYLEGDLKLGNLNILGGFRLERTLDSGVGDYTDTVAGVGITNTIQQAYAIYGQREHIGSSYGNLFPDLLLRYQLTSDLVAHASFTETIGRPNLSSIIPGITEGGTEALPAITIVNEGLKPQLFKNYELSLDYTLKPVGVLSGDVFYKTIKDYIATFTSTITPNESFAGYDLSTFAGGTLATSINGGSAYADGAELNFNRSLSDVPAFGHALRGVDVFANWTILKSEGNYGKTTPQQLANFIPHTFNVGISDQIGPFFVSLKQNWLSHYLFSAGTSGVYTYNIYAAARRLDDFYISYQFWRNFNVFFDWRNIGNSPSLDLYQGAASRVYEYQLVGSALHAGIKADF